MYNEYNTLSTAEYNDIVSDTYDDYLESWFTPHDTPKVPQEQETEQVFTPNYTLDMWKRGDKSKNAFGIMIDTTKDRSFKELIKLLFTAAKFFIPVWKSGYKLKISKSYDYPCPDIGDDTELPF